MNYSRENYEIDYNRIPDSDNGRVNYFAPSIQSLKAAQEIVRRYEKRRRTAAKLNRQGRGTATSLSSGLGARATDNVVPFQSPVWTRPTSRIIYSRHASPPWPQPPAPRARQASHRTEVLRLSRYIGASRPSPVSALRPAICDGVEDVMLDPLAVMAIQGLAVVLGLSGLFALLTLF